MDVGTFLPVGQQQARTRWGTHTSGAAFDRKKTPYLTEQAQAFMTQQVFCVIAGLGPENELRGILAMARPGFVQTPDRYTCLLQLDGRYRTSRVLRGVQQGSSEGWHAQLGFFFICHSTRERLCVQGTAELLSNSSFIVSHLFGSRKPNSTVVRLNVRQAFFHCAKYIKTSVAGLTSPVTFSSQQIWRPQDLLNCSQKLVSEEVSNFISQQVLCFLCTVDRHGQCAVNHRGGASGFLVTLPPDETSPGGRILIPDYAGNGAFEAIGNILETGQAAIVVPNYAAQLALCISGSARVVELQELSAEQARSCTGAQRVVMLSVERIETQSGDWSTTLAYERARAEAFVPNKECAVQCRA